MIQFISITLNCQWWKTFTEKSCFFCLHRSTIGNQNPKYAKPNFEKIHQIKMSPEKNRKSTRKFAKQISRKLVSIIANIDYQNNNVIKIRNLTLIIEMIQCKMFNLRFDPQFHIWGMFLRSLLYFYFTPIWWTMINSNFRISIFRES